MPIVPVTHQSWLFSPPLDMPLQLRLENGRFDSLRRRPLPAAPPCATTHVVRADDPSNPTGADVHFANGLHQATDLASVAGNCVYSAYSGRVAEVNSDAAGTKGSVSIDHHPRGLGFLTQYIHITDIRVEAGDFVHEGEPFAQVSAVPDQPTLHLELWAIIDRGELVHEGATGDSDMVPVDPTRALYAWEQRLVADEPLAGSPVPLAVGVTRIHTVPFFFARFEADLTMHVPLYEPVTEDERLTICLLREAHGRGAGVALAFRPSSFWGGSTWSPRRSWHRPCAVSAYEPRGGAGLPGRDLRRGIAREHPRVFGGDLDTLDDAYCLVHIETGKRVHQLYAELDHGDDDRRDSLRDDDLFNAVLISAGRFGVVYSIVLRAVRQYSLHEHRRLTIWEVIRGLVGDPTQHALRVGAHGGT